MFINIDGNEVFYQRHLGKGTPVLLLHGWGANSRTMTPIFDYLVRENRSVISIDLLGFGQSTMPPPHFGIFDYAELVQKFLKLLDIQKVILLGHSFGGRISIILASRTNLVSRLVLVDSAGIKPKRRLSYYINVYKYKWAKKKNKDTTNYGSEDYRALPECMKGVFCRVVGTFLEGELKNITCPTLIMWGENDTDTPLYMAKRINKGIKDSAIIILAKCGHYSYLDNIPKFNLIFGEFVKGE